MPSNNDYLFIKNYPLYLLRRYVSRYFIRGSKLPVYDPGPYRAAREGYLETFTAYIVAGRNINSAIDKKDNRPLHVAVVHGQSALVRLLLDCGAQVNIKNSLGYTPLQLAAIQGHVAIVKQFISAKAKLNALGPEGNTVVHLVLKKLSNKWDKSESLIEILNLLVEAKADLNLVNADGLTALHIACKSESVSSQQLKVIEMLIKHGADVNRNNRWCFPPLGYLLKHIPNKTYKDQVENIIHLFIQKHSDIYVRLGPDCFIDGKFYARDPAGKNLLSEAIINGYHALAKFLIHAGFNPRLIPEDDYIWDRYDVRKEKLEEMKQVMSSWFKDIDPESEVLQKALEQAKQFQLMYKIPYFAKLIEDYLHHGICAESHTPFTTTYTYLYDKSFLGNPLAGCSAGISKSISDTWEISDAHTLRPELMSSIMLLLVIWKFGANTINTIYKYLFITRPEISTGPTQEPQNSTAQRLRFSAPK